MTGRAETPTRGLFAILALLGCGRTTLLDDVLPRADAGAPDAGLDAGPVVEPRCPAPPPNSGRVWGTTPLGDIDFKYVWVGTEGPWSHSCPHLTVVAAAALESDGKSGFSVDFNYFQRPAMLGPATGLARVTVEGKTVMIPVTANVTRADGLSGSPWSPGWRTTLTFAADGGSTLQGKLVEVPDCPWATWFCI